MRMGCRFGGPMGSYSVWPWFIRSGFKDMLGQKNFRNQEIARLQLELASASQRLDELEKRSRLRACQKAELGFIDGTAAASVAESAELRFAANVASGMTKLQFG
jgi:hypothetical protein